LSFRFAKAEFMKMKTESSSPIIEFSLCESGVYEDEDRVFIAYDERSEESRWTRSVHRLRRA